MAARPLRSELVYLRMKYASRLLPRARSRLSLPARKTSRCAKAPTVWEGRRDSHPRLSGFRVADILRASRIHLGGFSSTGRVVLKPLIAAGVGEIARSGAHQAHWTAFQLRAGSVVAAGPHCCRLRRWFVIYADSPYVTIEAENNDLLHRRGVRRAAKGRGESL